MDLRSVLVTIPARGDQFAGWRSSLDGGSSYRPAELREVTVRSAPDELSDDEIGANISAALRLGYGCRVPVDFVAVEAYILARRPA